MPFDKIPGLDSFASFLMLSKRLLSIMLDVVMFLLGDIKQDIKDRYKRSHDTENHCGYLISLDLAKSPL